MRGHLGTMLAQKAGTVLECKKQGGIINVSCSDARHQEVPDWNIMFTDEGCIVDADAQMQQQRQQHRDELQQRRQEANEQKVKERTELALTIIRDNGGYISRKELTEKLMERTGLKRTTVSSFVSSLLGTVLYETDGTIQSTPEAAIPF